MASVTPRGGRRGKRLMAEMNVVPYIDVTLVLLIIFMVTAPLVTQSVNVELPQAASKVVDTSDKEPVIVTIDAKGQIFCDLNNDPGEPIEETELVTKLASVNKYKPGTQFLVRGDAGVNYGRVVEVFAMMQAAGLSNVGLMTDPPAKK